MVVASYKGRDTKLLQKKIAFFFFFSMTKN